ncbi:uncharacterized protein [Gossypium hirsutum]|uniref:Uncharacterized protein n=1 Tax=Gossypium hirsutum TaxID=3635 RepID=A0ABM3B9W9_GOSHI|nr:uncharacterized protein LOC121224494 [Gossypium hirsutum]
MARYEGRGRRGVYGGKTSSGGVCAKARTLAEARHVRTNALGGCGVARIEANWCAWRLLGFATVHYDIGPFVLNRFAGFRFRARLIWVVWVKMSWATLGLCNWTFLLFKSGFKMPG